MPKKKKPERYDPEKEKQQQAANRRALLKSLKPKAREFAKQEFAKLGLLH